MRMACTNPLVAPTRGMGELRGVVRYLAEGLGEGAIGLRC
jgi:hypothetical protein